MAKYKVLELLSTSGADIQPGAVIEIDDDQVATILLEKGCIKPAERQPKTRPPILEAKENKEL
jgi:hypothetical protein